MLAVILSSALLKLRHLGHTSLGSVDECCHALVANWDSSAGPTLEVIVDSENKFTFYEIYVRLYDYEIFNRFTRTRP